MSGKNSSNSDQDLQKEEGGLGVVWRASNASVSLFVCLLIAFLYSKFKESSLYLGRSIYMKLRWDIRFPHVKVKPSRLHLFLMGSLMQWDLLRRSFQYSVASRECLGGR